MNGVTFTSSGIFILDNNEQETGKIILHVNYAVMIFIGLSFERPYLMTGLNFILSRNLWNHIEVHRFALKSVDLNLQFYIKSTDFIEIHTSVNRETSQRKTTCLGRKPLNL